MFWLEENLILSNVLIRGESNFDEKNVEEVFNMCSTEQSCINIGITCYKIGTLEFSHSKEIIHIAQDNLLHVLYWQVNFPPAGAIYPKVDHLILELR